MAGHRFVFMINKKELVKNVEGLESVSITNSNHNVKNAAGHRFVFMINKKELVKNVVEVDYVNQVGVLQRKIKSIMATVYDVVSTCVPK